MLQSFDDDADAIQAPQQPHRRPRPQIDEAIALFEGLKGSGQKTKDTVADTEQVIEDEEDQASEPDAEAGTGCG
jgi:hypothetical protein